MKSITLVDVRRYSEALKRIDRSFKQIVLAQRSRRQRLCSQPVRAEVKVKATIAYGTTQQPISRLHGYFGILQRVKTLVPSRAADLHS